jgi:hypothetical protein
MVGASIRSAVTGDAEEAEETICSARKELGEGTSGDV